MLQAVLGDLELQKFGGYAPADVDGLSVDDAVISENAVVHAVGVIIDRIDDESLTKWILFIHGVSFLITFYHLLLRG